MGEPPPRPQRPNYGIDAPTLVRNFFLIGISGLVLIAVKLFVLDPDRPMQWWHWVLNTAIGLGIYCLIAPCVMIWGSKVGKLRLRDRVLDSLHLRGDETVLDVGCGRGLMLIGAAKRLTTGKAVGVDIWQRVDQSGNRPEATWENARIEGVAGRIEVQSADARQLPFADGSFDVVVSSWALHNIYNAEERAKALRVLRPGGRLTIVDIEHTRDYAELLRESGLTDVSRSRPNFLFIIPTHVVTGQKPGPSG
jgi:SAM-dependent methyltransferase